MNLLKGTVKNGQVILDEAADLPDGARVEVVPLEAACPALRMREEDWPTTPEGITALLARMDQLEPGWLSSEDEAAWKTSLQAHKEFEKATFNEWSEKLRKTCE